MINFKVKVTTKTDLKVKCPVCGRLIETKMNEMAPGMDLDVHCECGNTVKIKAGDLKKVEKKVGFLSKILNKPGNKNP